MVSRAGHGAGLPGPGRPKGSKDKIPRMIKESILEAAKRVGEDGKGKGGVIGYLRWAAKQHPASFLALIGRCVPLEVKGNNAVVVDSMVTRIELVAAEDSRPALVWDADRDGVEILSVPEGRVN